MRKDLAISQQSDTRLPYLLHNKQPSRKRTSDVDDDDGSHRFGGGINYHESEPIER